MAELGDAEELIIKSFVRHFSAINKNGLKILRLLRVGSNPTLTTVCVAEMVYAPDCGSGLCGFNSRRTPQLN